MTSKPVRPAPSLPIQVVPPIGAVRLPNEAVEAIANFLVGIVAHRALAKAAWRLMKAQETARQSSQRGDDKRAGKGCRP